jgi:hypothetical protein
MSAEPMPAPTFEEALALLRRSVSITVEPLTDAQIARILARDAAAEACNEVDE